MLIHCVKCKCKTETVQETYALSKNKKYMIKGRCDVCDTKKQQFITEKIFRENQDDSNHDSVEEEEDDDRYRND